MRSAVTSLSSESRVQDQRFQGDGKVSDGAWQRKCVRRGREAGFEIHEARSQLVKILTVTRGVRCKRRIQCLVRTEVSSVRDILWNAVDTIINTSHIFFFCFDEKYVK